MNIIEVVVVMVISFWTVRHLCREHATSGSQTKLEKGLPLFTIAIGLVAIDLYALAIHFPRDHGPMVVALAGHVVIRGSLYFWYVGSLSGIRRRWVERSRVRWQEELDWYEDHIRTVSAETDDLSRREDCDLSAEIRHNVWVIKSDMRERDALKRKLAAILP